MTPSTTWSEYVAATSELAAASRGWVEAEQRADANLHSSNAAADHELARRTAATTARQRHLQQLLDQGHAHLRRVGLEELLPKRIPTRQPTTASAPGEPDALLQRIDALASSLGEHRRDAERRRLETEQAERQRTSDAAERAAQRKALQTALLKISAGVAAALAVIASVRACTGQ